MGIVEPLRTLWRRLTAWDLLPTPGPEGSLRDGPVERPWRYYWDHLPKRTARADFSARDYQQARQSARASRGAAAVGPTPGSDLFGPSGLKNEPLEKDLQGG